MFTPIHMVPANSPSTAKPKGQVSCNESKQSPDQVESRNKAGIDFPTSKVPSNLADPANCNKPSWVVTNKGSLRPLRMLLKGECAIIVPPAVRILTPQPVPCGYH